MAVVVSFLGKVDFKDLAKAEKQLAGFRKNSEQTGTSFADIGKKALALGAAFGVGVAGVQGLVNVFKDSIAEAQEAIKVNAATAQIIEATGSAANVTADQVADLSQKISEQIAVDDELIQTSANLILTFKNVANQGEGLEAIFVDFGPTTTWATRRAEQRCALLINLPGLGINPAKTQALLVDVPGRHVGGSCAA